jgi:hypothetical protein
MQGIQEISVALAAQPTVISSEDLKALLYLTIRGHNGLTPLEKKQHAEGAHIDAENGVDVKA